MRCVGQPGRNIRRGKPPHCDQPLSHVANEKLQRVNKETTRKSASFWMLYGSNKRLIFSICRPLENTPLCALRSCESPISNGYTLSFPLHLSFAVLTPPGRGRSLTREIGYLKAHPACLFNCNRRRSAIPDFNGIPDVLFNARITNGSLHHLWR